MDLMYLTVLAIFGLLTLTLVTALARLGGES